MRNWNMHETMKQKKSEAIQMDVKEFLRDKPIEK